ncbi:hypothetical protein GCM10022419_118690 [Nonomuraea rosea]|uniref:Ricin B lectin domain-containing protein n=1 Tax=Nonomuraea rosea TaxID=638574 RepID=A0ABP6ZLN4_9ACTN
MSLAVRVVMKAANDNPNVQAVTYGPVVLSGDYGDTGLSPAPALTASSITRTSTSSLAFTATASGLALGIQNMSTADGGLAVQRADNGTADHRWRLRYGPGAAFRVQCANGGRGLGLGGTSQGAQVVLADDNGSNNNLWRFL